MPMPVTQMIGMVFHHFDDAGRLDLCCLRGVEDAYLSLVVRTDCAQANSRVVRARERKMNGTLAWLFRTVDSEGDSWLRGLHVEGSAKS